MLSTTDQLIADLRSPGCTGVADDGVLTGDLAC